jgi:hypothetical protein
MIQRSDAEIGQFYKIVNSAAGESSFTGRWLGILKEKKEGRLLFTSGISIPIEGPVPEFTKKNLSSGVERNVLEFETPMLIKETEEVIFASPLPPREYNATEREIIRRIHDVYEDKFMLESDVDDFISDREDRQIFTLAIGTSNSTYLKNFIKFIKNISGLTTENTLEKKINALRYIPEVVPDTATTSEVYNWLVQFDSDLIYGEETKQYVHEIPEIEEYDWEEYLYNCSIKRNIPQLYNTEYQGLLGKRRVLEKGLLTFDPLAKLTVPPSFSSPGLYKPSTTTTPEEIGKTYYDGLCTGCILPTDFPLNPLIPFIKGILGNKGYVFVVHEAWERINNQAFGAYCSNIHFETMCEIPTFFRTNFSVEEQARMYRIDKGNVYPLFHLPITFLNDYRTKPSTLYRSGPDVVRFGKFIRLPEEAESAENAGTTGGRRRSRNNRKRKTTQKRRKYIRR